MDTITGNKPDGLMKAPWNWGHCQPQGAPCCWGRDPDLD